MLITAILRIAHAVSGWDAVKEDKMLVVIANEDWSIESISNVIGTRNRQLVSTSQAKLPPELLILARYLYRIQLVRNNHERRQQRLIASNNLPFKSMTELSTHPLAVRTKSPTSTAQPAFPLRRHFNEYSLDNRDYFTPRPSHPTSFHFSTSLLAAAPAPPRHPAPSRSFDDWGLDDSDLFNPHRQGPLSPCPRPWSARPAPRHQALAPALAPAPAPAHLPAAVVHFLTILISQIFCEKDGYFVPSTGYILSPYNITW